MELSFELGCPFVSRLESSFAALARQYNSKVIVVVGERKISARIGEGEFFFHPSMALLRLMNHFKGQQDRMAGAMGLEAGMKVLDCTMGYGSDALVTSSLAGPGGVVVGLEGSPVVAALVKSGLRRYQVKDHAGLDPVKARVLRSLPEAMLRIEVVNSEHRAYLMRCPDKSFDVVYFDPMFRKPCGESASMDPLRELAVPEPVDVEAVREACRVARRRVVMKEGRYSGEFERLGFRVVAGGKYSEVAFGVIEVG